MQSEMPAPGSYEPFRLKEKIGEMMKYGRPLTKNFSRKDRDLADDMRVSMLKMYHLAVELEKKYYRKTTAKELDVELEWLRNLVRMLASISPDDENYEFITMTLAASLDELYCEQMNDSVGLSAYLKREERPLEKLPGEESVAGAEITYQFVFNALYRLSYTFSDPTQITVADRDNALQKFKTEFQNYVDNLSEADLTSSNIKTVLSEKADELENSLSTAKMKLSCEVENVEVHNAGEEIVNN